MSRPFLHLAARKRLPLNGPALHFPLPVVKEDSREEQWFPSITRSGETKEPITHDFHQENYSRRIGGTNRGAEGTRGSSAAIARLAARIIVIHRKGVVFEGVGGLCGCEPKGHMLARE